MRSLTSRDRCKRCPPMLLLLVVEEEEVVVVVLVTPCVAGSTTIVERCCRIAGELTLVCDSFASRGFEPDAGIKSGPGKIVEMPGNFWLFEFKLKTDGLTTDGSENDPLVLSFLFLSRTSPVLHRLSRARAASSVSQFAAE